MKALSFTGRGGLNKQSIMPSKEERKSYGSSDNNFLPVWRT